jgi:hypothetical protein
MPQETNWDRLRKDIDSGRTGDKVDFPDPAAAPLGTDSEAAGTPTDAAALARAHAYETRRQVTPKQDHGATLYVALIVGITGLMAVSLVLAD